MEEIEIRKAAQHVFDVMAPRVGADELQRIKDAFEMAHLAHKDQKRKTGAPYIIHPIAVATIAAEELELDANTVCAAFLHDVVEDTEYTIDDIRARFGDDVAFLVDVVTKRKKDRYRNSKQIDNYQQILESVHYDVRALLVKLADRLHNMRTLDSMRPDKQMKIAGETDFFYAPLAGRLGLYYVKTELENLSFRFRCPREYEMLEMQLQQNHEITAEIVDSFCRRIDTILSENGIKAYTEVRYRRPYSVWRDMRQKGCDFSHVDFKHYIRIVFQPMDEWSHHDTLEKDTALYIYSLLSREFRERQGSICNYIDNPKDNGYQSFHVKFLNHGGVWEELHIASERMHRNAKLGCVVERGESWIERFRSVLENVAGSSDGYIFMDEVGSSLYNEDIIAFTPKGKGIILPQGATALDFAYELHSDIGNHAHFARVNGKLCPVSEVLHRGDCVEIGSDSIAVPSAKWLTFVKTVKAKRCIREVLKNRIQCPYCRCEHCHPLPGDEVIGITDRDGCITVHSRNCSEAIRLASENGDALVSVQFEAQEGVTYPVKLKITAIDRYHLLRDIIDCVVEGQRMSLYGLSTTVDEQIMHGTLSFPVRSHDQLQMTVDAISAISGVDEVQVIDF
ncbi:MAG: HD domain-containing protein [Bacteroidaceae bacterium]|nr:HD domain-containing protein [Bacteroidaceae bacterium]